MSFFDESDEPTRVTRQPRRAVLEEEVATAADSVHRASRRADPTARPCASARPWAWASRCS